MRTFTNVQTLFVQKAQLLTSITIAPSCRLLIATSYNYIARTMHFYEYNKPFCPESSNDTAIVASIFSPLRLEFFIAERNFK